MSQVNAGRVRFVGRGEYNNSTQYYVFDLVSYNGNSYYAKVDTIGNLPTDTTYWQLVAEKGNVGPTGLTGNGISSITKTSTSGLVDTYTITYTNGNTTTFNVSNGNGIDRIEKTATVGNKDTYTIYFTNGSTTTYEVSNGEVTREELEEEVDRLSMIYNAFPSTTGETEEGSINGTAEVPFKEISLKGNTSQESTTGKNLWSLGNIESNGTYPSNTSILLGEIYFNTGTYTINLSNELINSSYLNIGTSGSIATGITKEKTFTISEAGNYPIRYIRTAGTYNNFVSLVQIETGSTATTYEPYTGGNPAPNPDYPYPVNVVTGDNEVKVEGKNLAPSDWASKFVNACNAPTLANITTKDNRNCLYYKINAGYGDYPHKNFTLGMTFKENTQYTISYDAFKVDATQKCLSIAYTDGTIQTGPLFSYVNTWEHQKITTTANKTVDYIFVGYYAGDTYIDIDTWQIEEGTTETPYEEHKEQTYPINLGSMELCKIGDYQDYIYKNNGIWYKYGAIGKVVLDGSETWYRTATNTTGYYRFYVDFGTNIISASTSTIASIYSDKFMAISRDNSYARRNGIAPTDSGYTYKSLIFYYDDVAQMSVADFKTWLATHNTTVYYVLNTPTITEITDTTLIEQLDNLEKAYSYDTQTNISQTNQDKPFIISYEAILSLRNILNS